MKFDFWNFEVLEFWIFFTERLVSGGGGGLVYIYIYISIIHALRLLHNAVLGLSSVPDFAPKQLSRACWGHSLLAGFQRNCLKAPAQPNPKP